MGMQAFAARARGELMKLGVNVEAARAAEATDELTAQERQIARLAADGLSNSEIGTRLFLSPRTVEWHLHKVFTKLGIRSRREPAACQCISSRPGTVTIRRCRCRSTPRPSATTCAPPAPHCFASIGPLTPAWDTAGPLRQISKER